jgi:beta-glucanase (GH16 family)
MKIFVPLALMVASALNVMAADQVAPKKLPGGYVYVWGDEFNGNKVDAKKWSPELGVIRNQGSQQTYTARPKNIRVENGNLVLETRFEKFANINFKKNGKNWIEQTEFMPYTSGSVTTIKTKLFLFGRLEVRAKLPKTKGIWPAIWLLGKNKWGWPTNGEIDMLENISQQPDVVYSTFHMSPDGVSDRDASRGGTVNIPNLSDGFHVYVMEWDKDSIRLLVDDKEVKTLEIDSVKYNDNAGNPFRTPFYLILNSAVGGNWCEKAPADGAGFPVKYLIDYVRFYQTKEQAEDAKKYDPQTGLPK